MNLSLTDLRLFLCVVEEANITRAATRQHLSLAAASTRIKAIEMQAGMPLLVRQARGVSPTPAGEAFTHHARQLLQQAASLRAELNEYGGGLKGHVRIYANTTAVTDFLPQILADFLHAHPDVSIDLQERANQDIARAVAQGRTDIGIVAGPVESSGLQSLHFSTDRLILVTPAKHALARRKRVSFAQILDEDFIGMHEGSTLQQFLAKVEDDLGKRLKPRIQLRGFDAMCRMIEVGVGVGILPESAARRHSATMAIALVDLADDWAVRERHLLVRDLERLPGYARDLLNEICNRHGSTLDSQQIKVH
ncbi:MAG: LysR family transcriptional regulator [Gammaproteobacteria bacterium]|jgi:DNA-binding transcriptional LysR family regulator|nr:LysR family transcriptional regulator [Gammaproteobacteria bacterium]MBU0788510.1 LysR family transcriptional regulator [Gammaproteobacteria bacterium]MBU0815666.1 LysR family transcriptional regulator [Gammaproteobacteria bacterium]MBU1788126.1 LysR family transcriptional regulator [Gammaproteobacteria bacterium]